MTLIYANICTEPTRVLIQKQGAQTQHGLDRNLCQLTRLSTQDRPVVTSDHRETPFSGRNWNILFPSTRDNSWWCHQVRVQRGDHSLRSAAMSAYSLVRAAPRLSDLLVPPPNRMPFNTALQKRGQL